MHKLVNSSLCFQAGIQNVELKLNSLDSRTSGSGINKETQRETKEQVSGLGLQPAEASTQDTPFCSHNNHKILRK